MLINCPECQKQISDKAYSCPNCGYPINSTLNNFRGSDGANTRSQKVKKNKYVPRRLPNGFGSIRHLSGNRRKPFAAHPPVKEYKDTENGVLPIVPKAIGYYETYEEAYDALRSWQKTPYDTDSRSLTFADIYEMWWKEKADSTKTISNSSKVSYQAAFKSAKVLHNRKFSTIKTTDYQECLNSFCDKSYSTVSNILLLFKQMSKYALKYDLIDKDYARFCYCPKSNDAEKGEPFSEEQIKVLLEHKDDRSVQFILIMIFSGMRIAEVGTSKIEDGCFVGGVKTKASKDRKIPIHPIIADFTDSVGVASEYSRLSIYRKNNFYPTLKRLGIENSDAGTKHTPHDCRHTFSWMADKYGMDMVSKHLIMGHALKGDVETTTYSHRTIEELKTEMNKIKAPK